MKYNQVYGDYSTGTGFWLDDTLFELGKVDMYHEDIIDSYIKQISMDFQRISVLDDIKDYEVMDVGTGRQALAIHRLGAKAIFHFDISKANIKRFNSYIKKVNIPIISKLADIGDENFNDKKLFDFIYLQGIIQHVKDPYLSIKNLSLASKDNAKIWFYNYQAGHLTNLYAEAFRKILSNNINFHALINQLKSKNFSTKSIDQIIDDCGCNYRHLINNNIYKNALEKFGFVRFYKKDVEIQDKGLDLKTKRSACISGFIKSKKYDEKNKITSKDFIHLDHFNPDNFLLEYRNFINEIRGILNKIIDVKEFFNMEQEKLVTICMPLFDGLANFNSNNSVNVNKNILLSNFKNSLVLAKSLK